MATRYRFGESHVPHFITTSVINWVDALSRSLYKDVIISALTYCIEKKNLVVHAWVIMNNHIHLVISAKNDAPRLILSGILKSTQLKSYWRR